jgi:GT2 family glycosyltransferase
MIDETKKWPLFSIVIVNYNGQEHLQRCISSALKSDYPNFEIIIVDNGSTDGSIKLLNELFGKESHLTMILNTKNLGPARARNTGSTRAKGEYLAFIDNDTEVDKLWLKEALEILKNRPEVGAIQCKLLLMDEQDKYDYAGDYLSQFGFLIQRASFGEPDIGQFNKIVEIFGVKSAGMVIRKNVFNACGGFDEDYFVYMEETDLCWRIWLNGWTVVFSPTSIVYHKFGNLKKLKLTSSKYLTIFHGTKNYITTMIKNLETLNLLKILPLQIILWMGIALRHIARKKNMEARWVVKGILYNFVFFGRIWVKRDSVQGSVRKVPDSYLMPRIMKRQPLTYFSSKLIRAERQWKI